MTPEFITVGEYHAQVFPSGRTRAAVPLDRVYAGVGIGRNSDIDAVTIDTPQGPQTISLAAPYMGQLGPGSLTLRPFYTPGPTAGPNSGAMPGSLELALYPEIPLGWPLVRGPRNGKKLAYPSSGVVETIPTYGRREARIWLESSGGTAGVRIEAAAVHSDGTLMISPVWPDPDDATSFESIADGVMKAVIALEGWEYLRIKHDTDGFNVDVHWNVWD